MNEETIIRLLFTVTIFTVMMIWEIIFPRRKLNTNKIRRWSMNIFITLFNSILVKIIFPLLPVSLALLAQKNNWGIFNNIQLPYELVFILSIVFFDFIIYLQHVMFHSLPILWRLHMMHHIDLDIDVTTALRFHPIEIIISAIIKLAVIMIIGPPVLSVLVFEIILNGTAMFNHSNVKMPRWLDRIIRLVIVTPDMHRIHHSVTIRETNSNFGFNLSWWDKLFGTYRSEPFLTHETMSIGHSLYRNEKQLNLFYILAVPFIGKSGDYSINRWGKELPKK